MSIEEFTESLKNRVPPEDISLLLKAMWLDAKGKWDEAHQIAQSAYNNKGAWVHAYLHRKEGDLSNASYWYNRAGKEAPVVSINEEWRKIVEALLRKTGR